MFFQGFPGSPVPLLPQPKLLVSGAYYYVSNLVVPYHRLMREQDRVGDMIWTLCSDIEILFITNPAVLSPHIHGCDCQEHYSGPFSPLMTAMDIDSLVYQVYLHTYFEGYVFRSV